MNTGTQGARASSAMVLNYIFTGMWQSQYMFFRCSTFNMYARAFFRTGRHTPVIPPYIFTEYIMTFYM